MKPATPVTRYFAKPTFSKLIILFPDNSSYEDGSTFLLDPSWGTTKVLPDHHKKEYLRGVSNHYRRRKAPCIHGERMGV